MVKCFSSKIIFTIVTVLLCKIWIFSDLIFCNIKLLWHIIKLITYFDACLTLIISDLSFGKHGLYSKYKCLSRTHAAQKMPYHFVSENDRESVSKWYDRSFKKLKKIFLIFITIKSLHQGKIWDTRDISALRDGSWELGCLWSWLVKDCVWQSFSSLMRQKRDVWICKGPCPFPDWQRAPERDGFNPNKSGLYTSSMPPVSIT